MNNWLFPAKNQAVHQLVEFFKIGNLLRFRERKNNQDASDWRLLEAYIMNFQHLLIGFENELLQTAETSTKETLDHYFRELSHDVAWILGQATEAQLVQQIEKWNAEAIQTFEGMVANTEGQFISSGERDRYPHLHEYEVTYPAIFVLNTYLKERKEKKVHARFICIELPLEQIDPAVAKEYYTFIYPQVDLFMNIVRKYDHKRQLGELKVGAFSVKHLPPIVFCEGAIDLDLIQRAAVLLGKTELLQRVALRYREGYKNLDALYNQLITNNWETIPQKKLLLYDCDVENRNEHSGHIHRRTIPLQAEHPIGKGIENLFPRHTINKAIAHKLAFFDIVHSHGTRRGVPFKEVTISIAREEKRNFCNYLLDQGTKADFKHFSHVFTIIEALLEDQ